MKELELGGGYRLHRLDSMNWELQHWHESDGSNNQKMNSGKAKWHRLGKYYQTLGGALAAVFELRMRDGDECGDLRDAMERAEEIRVELMSVRVKFDEVTR